MIKNLKFNAFQIKLAMALLMVVDHINHVPNLISPEMAGIFHVITRVVAAWFAYSAVEGFNYTHNRIKYNIRLFIWAAIMWIGNTFINISTGEYISNNIFLTFALGVLMLNILAIKNPCNKIIFKVIKSFVVLGLIVIGVIFAEGAIPLLPFMLLTYIFKDNIKMRNCGYLVLSLIIFGMSIVVYDTINETIRMLCYNSEFLFILVLPITKIYNGERGPKNKFSKYFFYIFYPMHLWILAIISYFVKLN